MRSSWHSHPAIRTGGDLSLGEKSADRMRNGMGSWRFFFSFLVFMGCWVVANSAFYIFGSHGKHGFDPYPYILLNLMLSTLAGLQGCILLIAARRQDQIASELAHHDLEVNKTSLEIIQKIEKLTTEIHSFTAKKDHG